MDVPISSHYSKNGTHNSVSLSRSIPCHKIKRRIVVYKDARSIKWFQVHTNGDSKFFLVSKFIRIIRVLSHFCEIVYPVLYSQIKEPRYHIFVMLMANKKFLECSL